MASRLTKAVRGFGCERGNVALMFALIVIPVIGFVGAAVDYSRGASVRADLQSALDSTALMLSKEAASVSSTQLQTDASSYFNALFNRNGAQTATINVDYTVNGGAQLVVRGSTSIPTSFLQLIGQKTIAIDSTSTVKWGMSRLRVALVLDNTGSMAEAGKIAALKTATLNLLSQLQTAATSNGDVYVSIVPFVKDVNAGSSNVGASWIDWTDWEAENGTCSSGGGHRNTKASCNGTWTPASHANWNGCVTDRGNSNTPTGQNYDTNVDPPIGNNPQSHFPAEQYDPCPQAAMGLSYDWVAMNTLVNNMTPGGNTNQAIGLAWGWLSLAGGGPFTAPPMDPNYAYSQIIILLTDGLNTQDRWYTNQASIDARQKMTCDNVKAAGITLYSIQVNTSTPPDPTSALLQQCASDPGKFFLLTSAKQIVTTFNTIGTNLSNLYLAR